VTPRRPPLLPGTGTYANATGSFESLPGAFKGATQLERGRIPGVPNSKEVISHTSSSMWVDLPAYKREGTHDCARASRFRTAERCSLAPDAERIPRSFNALAISARLFAPDFRTASRIGRIPAANWSAERTWAARPSDPAAFRFAGLPSATPLAFLLAEPLSFAPR
jgi:hypothetical protein